MNRETLPYTSHKKWLSYRVNDITSTMMPALFGYSPYTTLFELYHSKASNLNLPFNGNHRVDKGNRMEAYAANEYALQYGLEIEPFKDYMRLPQHRIGSSFDYVTKDRSKLIEIKAVDYFIQKSWQDDELPPHIEIQAQHEMLVSGISEIDVVVFVGIYDHFVYNRKADPEMHEAMIKAADKFWQDVANENEPEPDYYRDTEVIKALYKPEGELEDFSERDDIDEIVTRFQVNKEIESKARADKEAAKNELWRKLGNSVGGYTDHYRIKCGMTKDSDGKEVTQDMVGTRINARKGYRRCDITEVN